MQVHPSPHDCSQLPDLLALIRADHIDAALRTGLMEFVPCTDCDPLAQAEVLAVQQRLRTAWAARERYRARNARLARRTAERETRRLPSVTEKHSALPPAAAAILARAKARAAERGAS